MTFSSQGNKTPYCPRGGRYYRKKLSAANILEFFKLSANYRYRKLDSILFNKHNWKHCSKNRLTEKQHKSCSLPETFVAAKPTQTMVPDINLLWQAQLAGMSNKMSKCVVVSPSMRILWNILLLAWLGFSHMMTRGRGASFYKRRQNFATKVWDHKTHKI